MPANVKCKLCLVDPIAPLAIDSLTPHRAVVTGTPWELYQLPRQMYPNPDDAKFGGPPTRKRRANKPKDITLDTITERPLHPKSPLGLGQRQDAATSTTDLDRGDSGNRDREGGDSRDGTPRKVQKGQINALAKMLSALRR